MCVCVLRSLRINSIEKSRLTADSYSGGDVTWKARMVLFVGFALLAGGLAGSVVCPLCPSSSFFLSFFLGGEVAWVGWSR